MLTENNINHDTGIEIKQEKEPEKIKAKRGRKPKNIQAVPVEKPELKKRGRKPKGGKIVKTQSIIPIETIRQSVILHLKCSLKNIDDEQILPNTNISCIFSNSKSTNSSLSYNIPNTIENTHITTTVNNTIEQDISYNAESDIQNSINQKIKMLEQCMYINDMGGKTSNCFWCTCSFDTTSVYIPKYYIDNTCHVYGCFCTPQCAVAFLMKENIDDSTKFERYSLLNNLYSKNKKNINPAPDPHYMLDKFCGNLTIQEYRQMLTNDQLHSIIDKPIIRILPELYENNDDFIITNKIIQGNNYR